MISVKSVYCTLALLVIIPAFCTGAELPDAPPPKSFIETTSENLSRLDELHRKAESLIIQNKFRESIDIFKEIILLEPDDEEAYTQMGFSYLVLGEYEHAKEAFGQALSINPENELAQAGLEKIQNPDETRAP